MHNVKALPPRHFEPDSGVEHISRAIASRIHVSVKEQVFPAEGSESIQLDLLYPSESLDTFISRRLQPRLFHADLQLPAGFRKAMAHTRREMRAAAHTHPHAARKFGKLSALLDEHDELCSLARMYYATLLQG